MVLCLSHPCQLLARIIDGCVVYLLGCSICFPGLACFSESGERLWLYSRHIHLYFWLDLYWNWCLSLDMSLCLSGQLCRIPISCFWDTYIYIYLVRLLVSNFIFSIYLLNHYESILKYKFFNFLLLFMCYWLLSECDSKFESLSSFFYKLTIKSKPLYSKCSRELMDCYQIAKSSDPLGRTCITHFCWWILSGEQALFFES